MLNRIAAVAAAFCAGALAIGKPAIAQSTSWPQQKPVKFVVPNPPGGSNDATGRTIAEAITKPLGQTVIIENKPGASGSVAMEAVAASPADGYTLVVASDSVALQPILRKGLKWNVQKDFVPVVMFGTQPIVVATHAGSPYKTIQDLAAAAKASPGKIGYATSGQGSIQHLAGELMNQMAGIDLLHIPYKGGGQAVSDLVGGQVPAAVLGLAAVLPHARAGKVRILAVTSRTRATAVPEVPTLDETIAPGFDARQWAGLMAPAATPPDIIARLQKEIVAALAAPVTKERFDKLGFDVSGMAGKPFTDYLDLERARWSKLIAEKKLQLD